MPRKDEFSGEYVVRLVLPFMDVRVLGHAKVFDPDGSSGCNRFLGFVRMARFRVQQGADSLTIRYDVPRNSGIVRRLTDEVMRVGDGRYIGRGRYRLFGRQIEIFHFTLRRA